MGSASSKRVAEASGEEISAAAEAEWRRLRRQIELATEFWLAFLFSASQRDVQIMRERAAQMLEEHGRSMLVLRPKTPDELQGTLPMLLGAEAGKAGCVWVEALERDPAGKVSSPWGAAWNDLAMRMNERRDALRRHLPGGFVLAGPPEIKPDIRDGASDLWSVRSIVLEVPEGPVPESRAAAELSHDELDFIVAVSPAMQAVLSSARRIAQSRIPVLLTGETGTGKERVARFIHSRSPRHNGPLVFFNCATVPGALMESMLFGQEKGAFTGAERNRGFFEQANGGTLCLDEVDELSASAQAGLLRVLETNSIIRIGSTKEIAVDIRIIALTHHDLEKMCADGKFRDDLLYRLNTFTLLIPPLRERVDDIPPLAELFLHQVNSDHKRPIRAIAQDALAVLARYSWPGNVRELRYVIEQAALLCTGDVITPRDLLGQIPPEGLARQSQWAGGLKARLQRVEMDIIREALQQVNGNLVEAARLLEVPLRTLMFKLKSYGIRTDNEPKS